MHQAIRAGQPGILRLLIAKGAKLEPASKQMKGIMTWLARRGYAEIADILIGRGVGLDEKGIFGDTALQVAVEEG